MVTASHNPPEYNGYKAYWGNGAQIIPPTDVGIAKAIEKAPAAKAPAAKAPAAKAAAKPAAKTAAKTAGAAAAAKPAAKAAAKPAAKAAIKPATKTAAKTASAKPAAAKIQTEALAASPIRLYQVVVVAWFSHCLRSCCHNR